MFGGTFIFFEHCCAAAGGCCRVVPSHALFVFLCSLPTSFLTIHKRPTLIGELLSSTSVWRSVLLPFPGSPLMNNIYGCPFWFSVFSDSELGVSPEDSSSLCNSLFSICLALLFFHHPRPSCSFSSRSRLLFWLAHVIFAVSQGILFQRPVLSFQWYCGRLRRSMSVLILALWDETSRWGLRWMRRGLCRGDTARAEAGCGKKGFTQNRFHRYFSLILRLTLSSSSASLSSWCRNFSRQTWEAMSPASTCKYPCGKLCGPCLGSRRRRPGLCWQGTLARALARLLSDEGAFKMELPTYPSASPGAPNLHGDNMERKERGRDDRSHVSLGNQDGKCHIP